MITNELLAYIKEQKSKSVYDEEIKKTLLANGWQEHDITEAFQALASPVPTAPTPQSPPFAPLQTPSSPAVLPAGDAVVAVTAPAKKHLLLPVIAAVVVFLVGGATLGYAYYQSSSPQKTVAKMFGNFSKIKSSEFSGSITANIESDALSAGVNAAGTTEPAAKQKLNLGIDFSGASDIGDLANPKFQLALKFKGDMKETGSFSLAADLRSLEKNFYFKISNLPNIGIADLSPFSDKWIKLSGEELKNSPLLNQASSQSQNTPPQENKPLTTAQIQKLEQFITEHQFIKVTGKLADETLAGVPTKHFRFVFDKQAYKDFAKELSDNSDYKLDKTQLDKMNESLDGLNSADGEMWIGKKDAMLYKVVLNFNLTETSDSKTSGRITFTLSFSNYNQPVTVTAPSPVLPFEEVLNQLLGGASSALDEATAKSRDALRLADVRQIMTALELYFNDNNKYPNTIDELIKSNAYLAQVPQSPTPPDGACTPEQNNFAYQLLKPDKYELTFCLGADAGGYGPGAHTASPEGIK
ncbi:MAG: hypothetical protein Q8N81_01900 [bacterium]|nr:hypothetical protein [bacterium]